MTISKIDHYMDKKIGGFGLQQQYLYLFIEERLNRTKGRSHECLIRIQQEND